MVPEPAALSRTIEQRCFLAKKVEKTKGSNETPTPTAKSGDAPRLHTSTAKTVDVGRRAAQVGAGAMAMSVAVHAALAAVAFALPTTFSTRFQNESEVFVEFTAPQVEMPPPVIPPSPLTPEQEAQLPSEPARTDRPQTPSPQNEQVTGGEMVLPGEVALEPTGPLEASPEITPPNTGELNPAERQRLTTLMAPGNVASSFAVRDATGPVATAGPAGVHVTGGRPALATEAEVERSLSGGLRREIMARPWLSQTHPTLVQRPDGSREYTGHAFTARIMPDGSVRFSDRGPIEGGEMLQGGPARFDITDMIMGSQGQDPYRAEREWFMEETEEVRVELETAAAARIRADAMAGVPGRLAAMWGRSTPAPIRRRAIFRMWDECDEEGDGATVRRQVIAFIRAEIPQTSADAFTVEEMRRWNSDRESAAEFAPYH